MAKEFEIATLNNRGESVKMMLSESGVLNCGNDQNLKPYEECVTHEGRDVTAGKYIFSWALSSDRGAEERAAAAKFLIPMPVQAGSNKHVFEGARAVLSAMLALKPSSLIFNNVQDVGSMAVARNVKNEYDAAYEVLTKTETSSEVILAQLDHSIREALGQ